MRPPIRPAAPGPWVRLELAWCLCGVSPWRMRLLVKAGAVRIRRIGKLDHVRLHDVDYHIGRPMPKGEVLT
jgi:hypothetical protein